MNLSADRQVQNDASYYLEKSVFEHLYSPKTKRGPTKSRTPSQPHHHSLKMTLLYFLYILNSSTNSLVVNTLLEIIL
jgi:hypothetical protein